MTQKPVPNRYEAPLRKFALSLPGTIEKFPWGHRAIKVNRKTFLFLAADESGLHLSVKLPESRGVALTLDFAAPTGYGLGRSGWVTASFGRREKPPLDLMREWIEESYRAIAPKKLVLSLDSKTTSINAVGPHPHGSRSATRFARAALGLRAQRRPMRTLR